MLHEEIRKITMCRACGKKKLFKVFSFGSTPNANSYVSSPDKVENIYPLEVEICKSCGLLQLGHSIDPKILFKDYLYVSSTSPVFVQHFEEYAATAVEKFNIKKGSLVIDIGSNDGALLKSFKKLNMRVLGIDPAMPIAKKAIESGIPTIINYFDIALAGKIKKQKGSAKIITANNTVAQISDLDKFVKGIYKLLDKDGVFIMEVPYILNMLKNLYFDLIYHEHHSLWSILPLKVLFERFNMEIFAVERVSVHGGSVRVFVKKKQSVFKKEKSVNYFLKLEKSEKIGKEETYKKFFSKVWENRIELLSLLTILKKKNKTIAGYGAPAKANTLLNYYSIGTDILDYIVDDSPWKQGMLTPGRRIPVVSKKTIDINRPNYLLILAWNFTESIIKNSQDFRNKGGKFIIPFPKPAII